jgi:hypothetical protein
MDADGPTGLLGPAPRPGITNRITDQAGTAVMSRTSRRGFLARAALAGSALTVAPMQYLLRPVSAYAAVCNCSGQSCACGSTCCDGYTEFCCTLTGTNTCPPGTAAGGWWKADAPGLCGSAPRYYLDCNVLPGQSPCGCGCGNGNCNNRKACCTHFRYGQCHREIASMGAIMCRVVTCTPPWQFDPTCTTQALTDNNTRFHDAPCLRGSSTPYPPKMRQGTIYLRMTLNEGPANHVFNYGRSGDAIVMGDWDGNGITTPATFRDGSWYFSNTNNSVSPVAVTRYGNPGDIPVVGNWDGNGGDGIGTFLNGKWYLRNHPTQGGVWRVLNYGYAGDIPVVGDWDGDGVDGIGIYRNGMWYLRNSPTQGSAEVAIRYGYAGDLPVVGDWNGDGVDGIGIFRNGMWYLRNSPTQGTAQIAIRYGRAGDIPLAGRWAPGQGVDTMGTAV